jgi:yecA family protein
MARIDIQTPPTRKELSQLEALLAKAPKALSLTMTHGLMVAVASAPGMVMPSAWIQRVVGDAVFESEKQAQQVFGTLMRLFNHILDDLNAGKLTILGEDRRKWCVGYVAGVDMDGEWMGNSESLQMIAPITVVAEGRAPRGIDDPEGFLQACRDNLESFAIDIHRHFIERRRKEMAVQPARNQVPQVGRNTPCPCGSGKKYKRCCGS